MNERFPDRAQAGRMLADSLAPRYRGRNDVVVIALPRGGVPVGYEIARAIGAPLDVLVVRKLGLPHQPELAMGAIATGGVEVVHDEVAALVGPDVLEQVAAREKDELERRERAFRGGRAPLDVGGKAVIVVDDGLATGSTMRAAIQSLSQRGVGKVVVAVPTAPPQTTRALEDEVDELVCLMTPEPFIAIGRWYEDFAQLSDQDVQSLLAAQFDPQAIVRRFDARS
jgi:putative phosphoribosyl transferase